MIELTKEELTTILLWGLDRIEAIGINNFTEEGHMELFHKLQEMVVYDNPLPSGKESLEASTEPA